MEEKKEVLTLTLKRKWFDMILSGEKKEEYRQIKPYWDTRLTYRPEYHAFKDFSFVTFINGCSKTAPRFTIECKGIEIRNGKVEWGAEPDVEYFVIKLGGIINN